MMLGGAMMGELPRGANKILILSMVFQPPNCQHKLSVRIRQ